MKSVKEQEIKLSIKQIEDMKHSIGLNENSTFKKKVKLVKTYEYYRNYFTTSDKGQKHLDELVDSGLMTKRTLPDWHGGGICYFVSSRGLQFLEKLLNISIVERK